MNKLNKKKDSKLLLTEIYLSKKRKLLNVRQGIQWEIV